MIKSLTDLPILEIFIIGWILVLIGVVLYKRKANFVKVVSDRLGLDIKPTLSRILLITLIIFIVGWAFLAQPVKIFGFILPQIIEISFLPNDTNQGTVAFSLMILAGVSMAVMALILFITNWRWFRTIFRFFLGLVLWGMVFIYFTCRLDIVPYGEILKLDLVEKYQSVIGVKP